MSRLEDLGGEVAAWVVIPKDDNSSMSSGEQFFYEMMPAAQ
jgi:hypothetical protein